MALANKKCIPSEKGTLPLSKNEVQSYLAKLKFQWELMDNDKIKHKFEFKDFRDAIKFVNNVADIAEEQNHHPNMTILYNKVIIALSTHSIGGLSENDFIIAAKIEKL